MLQGEKVSKGLFALLLAISLAFPVYATDIKTNEQKKDALEQERNQAQSELNALETQLSVVVSDMRNAQAEMQKTEAAIEEAEDALIQAKVSVNAQNESMRWRIKYMYENGNANMLELLFESEDMTDFLNKAEYITLISNYDREKLEEYKETVSQVEAQEKALQEKYATLSQQQENLIQKRATVENLMAQQKSTVDSLSAEINDLKTVIANAKAAEKRRQEAANANKGNASTGNNSSTTKPSKPVISGNGYFCHPCPGMSYQSSYFGEVRHGIGDTRPHKGHDYAAAQGTPIYAAAAGNVLIAGYSNSAGYWVVIDHGGGLTTKYMHMYAMPLVSAGQNVTKGQHIGGVGTTGQSTGNHLHFQVEEYGTAVNPDKYL